MSANTIRVTVLGLLLAAAHAFAQTRTDEIEAARDKKSQTLQEERVTGLESILLQIKQGKVLDRLTAGYNGLRVQFGSMATGSGFALGPQFFREDLFSGRMTVVVSAALSASL